MDQLWTPWRYAYVTDEAPLRAGVPAALAAWPGETGCVFCNMLAAAHHAVASGMPAAQADRAAHIVFRAEHCFVVLNAFPYTNGHSMIVPYAHVDALHLMAAPAAAEMMQLAQRMDRALRNLYQPGGINMGLNLGKAAGAGVAGHLHLHALPRWVGDTNFMTVTAETRVLPEALEVTWQRLQQELLQI